MSHILTYETGMPVPCILCLLKTDNGLNVLIHWKELGIDKNLLEPISQVYEGVSRIFFKLFAHQSTLRPLVKNARNCRGLLKEECTNIPALALNTDTRPM